MGIGTYHCDTPPQLQEWCHSQSLSSHTDVLLGSGIWGRGVSRGVSVPDDFDGQAEMAPTTSPMWDDNESRESEFREVARWKPALRREYYDVVYPFLFALNISKSGKKEEEKKLREENVELF